VNRLICLLGIAAITSLSSGRATAAAPAATHRPFSVTIVDDQGNRVHLSHRPTRIVSLFADYTEILFALGLEKRIVGDGSQYAEGATGLGLNGGTPRPFRYPSEWPSRLGRDYPVVAPRLPHVEGGFQSDPFNLETIESLRPDLVVAPYYASQTEVYQKMHDLGLKVVFLNPANLVGVFHDIELVGVLTGTASQASSLVTYMKKSLGALKARLAHVRTRPRVYYEIDGTNPSQPYTAGPGTVVDEAIKLAGGRNIADSVSTCAGTTCYPQFGLESLVAADPQIIVLADAVYGATKAGVAARLGWSSISAVRSGKIDTIDPDLLSRFGPRVIIGVVDLARLIHPEAFRR